VADVRLYRTQPAALLGLAAGQQHRLQRLHFDRITQDRARTMRLHKADGRRLHARIFQCPPDHVLLGRPVGRSQPIGEPVLVDRRTANHGQHPIAVAQGTA